MYRHPGEFFVDVILAVRVALMKRLLAFTFFVLFAALCALAAGRGWAGQVLGDPVRGGRIYENWMITLDVVPPPGNHPLWNTQDVNKSAGTQTWTCVACHGWDYKGAAGAYGQHSTYYTGFKGITGIVGGSQAEVLSWLNGSANANHDFSSYLDSDATRDLIAFLRTRLVDTDLMINPTNGGALGNAEEGRKDFQASCADCHGADGSEINFGTEDSPLYLADIAVADPWRFVHKTRFGATVAPTMPASEELGWSLGRVTNLLAVAQGLTRGNPALRPFNRNSSGPVQLESQARIEPLVWAAVGLFAVVVAGAAYDYYQQHYAPGRRHIKR